MKKPVPGHARWPALLPGLCCGLWALFIVAASLAPPSIVSAHAAGIGGHDKEGHAAVYGIFALLAIWALRGRSFPMRAGAAAIGTALFGLFMELGQHFVSRTFSMGDLVANTVGIALAVTLVAAIRLLSARKAPAAQPPTT